MILRRSLFAAAWLAGCRASSTPSDATPNAVDAEVIVDAEAEAEAPAPAPVEAGPAPFSADAWLREQSITTWSHDPSCWSNMAHPPAAPSWANLCECNHALTLNARPLLVCTRYHDQPEARLAPVLHTVVWAPQNGTLRTVLDLPTGASLDGESFANLPVGNVKLAATVQDADLVVADEQPLGYGAASCVDALAVANRDKLADVRRLYARVCASAGRWRFVGEKLVRRSP